MGRRPRGGAFSVRDECIRQTFARRVENIRKQILLKWEVGVGCDEAATVYEKSFDLDAIC